MTSLVMLVVLAAAVPAPVTRAVVYGGQARLTRTSAVAVDGPTRVELPLLPAAVDPDSVRVEVTGAILETVEVARLGPDSLDLEEARTTVRALGALDDELGVARAEAKALEDAGQAGDESPEGADEDTAVWAKLDPARWKQTLAFLRGWRERLDGRAAAVAERVGLLEGRREALEEQAKTLAAGQGGRVRVVMHLAGRGQAEVQTSYLLPGPSWEARYEVYLDAAHDVVDVSLAALAAQATGEDWTHAALVFSTATPLDTLAYPELRRWTVGERDRFIPRTVVPARSVAPPRAAPVVASSPELAALREKLGHSPPAAERAVFEVGGKVDGLPVGGSSRPEPEPLTPVVGGAGIIGNVYDQTGNPIRGVKVTASSRAQVGGARSTYSGWDGSFRLRGLVPATYEVRATAPKLRTVIQRDIHVGAAQPAEVSVIMEVESSGVEEVSVVEKAPLVNTTAAFMTDGFDRSFVSAAAPGRASPAGPTISLAPPEGTSSSPLGPGQSALAAGHALSFPALAPETVMTGATAQPVPLASWRWPASVRRRLYPAVRPEAYLVASLRSPVKEPLPAGEAALFVDGAPSGHAPLALVRPGDELTLPLGIDRAVRATREIHLAAHGEGILDRADVSRYTVVIDVVNPHRHGVAIDVVDQLPRARDGSVEVTLESSTAGAKVEDGKIVWQTGVGAGATRQFRFVYRCKRPQGYRLHQ